MRSANSVGKSLLDDSEDPEEDSSTGTLSDGDDSEDKNLSRRAAHFLTMVPKRPKRVPTVILEEETDYKSNIRSPTTKPAMTNITMKR